MTVPRQNWRIVSYVNPASSETTVVIRVWTEPRDKLLRGRVIDITSGDELVARGVEGLLEAVGELLDRFETNEDH